MSEKLGRNDPCRCGSGKKYKKCCLPADEKARVEAMEKRASQEVRVDALGNPIVDE